MLKQFGPEIWIVDGPEVSTGGFHYGTRMAVIRLSDGGLFIWSPIKLTEALRFEADALGEVRHLVAPNSLHHLFLDDWRLSLADGVTRPRHSESLELASKMLGVDD